MVSSRPPSPAMASSTSSAAHHAGLVRAHGPPPVVRDRCGELRPRSSALLGASLADRARTPGPRGPTPEPPALPRPRHSARPGAARCGWHRPDARRCARSWPATQPSVDAGVLRGRGRNVCARRCVDARWSWASTKPSSDVVGHNAPWILVRVRFAAARLPVRYPRHAEYGPFRRAPISRVSGAGGGAGR